MSDSFPHLNDDEQFKAENDFLKMKLMLEHGAKFPDEDALQTPLSPSIEHDFLKYIMAFEEQSKNPTYIKVYDRIGRPRHFLPSREISDEEVQQAWKTLDTLLRKHNISLDVCSPNISVRELYRFTIEELFDYEMSDMNLPGMMTNFIYDEFHPDPVYDNTRMAIEDCIEYILKKIPMEWMPVFVDQELRLNHHSSITADEFKQKVNTFKAGYDDLVINSIICDSCNVQEDACEVAGSYSVTAVTDIQSCMLSGNWVVHINRDKELGYWYIHGVEISGINF